MVALNSNDAILGDFKRLPCKTLVTRTNTAATIMFLRCIPMDLALFSEKKTKKNHSAPLVAAVMAARTPAGTCVACACLRGAGHSAWAISNTKSFLHIHIQAHYMYILADVIQPRS